LEENAQDICQDRDVFSLTPNTQAAKAKLDNWDCIKLKVYAKEAINRVKEQLQSRRQHL
jgi:hypothetical protein